MFGAWRPDRPNGTWVAKPCLTEWGHQIHIWDFSAGGYTLTLSCWGDSQLRAESVNIYLFIKKPRASVITAASLHTAAPLSTRKYGHRWRQTKCYANIYAASRVTKSKCLTSGRPPNHSSLIYSSTHSSHEHPRSVLSKEQTITLLVSYFFYISISIAVPVLASLLSTQQVHVAAVKIFFRASLLL